MDSLDLEAGIEVASFPGLPCGGGGRPGTHCMRMRANFPTFQEFRSTPGFLRVGVVTTVYYPDTYSVIYQYIA